jgi:hypothetical protein
LEQHHQSSRVLGAAAIDHFKSLNQQRPTLSSLQNNISHRSSRVFGTKRQTLSSHWNNNSRRSSRAFGTAVIHYVEHLQQQLSKTFFFRPVANSLFFQPRLSTSPDVCSVSVNPQVFAVIAALLLEFHIGGNVCSLFLNLHWATAMEKGCMSTPNG